MKLAQFRALILETPAVIHGWGFQVFVPQRDVGNVASMNELAIEMHSLESEWVADLAVDAVRKGILPRDVLRMWTWGARPRPWIANDGPHRPRLKAQVRDNLDDAATFRTMCRILADHAGELDSGLAEALKPAPAGGQWVTWERVRAMSRDAFDPGDKWVARDEACRRLGISSRTLKRWAAEELVAPRLVGGSAHWNIEALYFARVIKRYRVVQGRLQNRERDPVDVLDEVLDEWAA